MLRLEDLPGRVFLDTCVVNFILDYGEQIHDNLEAPATANERIRQNIGALRNTFVVGARANWRSRGVAMRTGNVQHMEFFAQHCSQSRAASGRNGDGDIDWTAPGAYSVHLLVPRAAAGAARREAPLPRS